MNEKAAKLIKDRYTFDDLVEIMTLLRSEGGCPWDREQTHESIRKKFIEETYEAVEAIDARDYEHLKEELGDVMLQVVFHAQMENEVGRFDIDDVMTGVCSKLVVRHPHIFGDVTAETSEKVLLNWDEIKLKNRKAPKTVSTLDEVPRQLPALMRSLKLVQRAEKSGCVLPDTDECISATKTLMDSLFTAPKTEYEEIMGKVLLNLSIIAQKMQIEPEEALTKASDWFIIDCKEGQAK